MDHTLNIAVLFGGCSSEYSISLQSAHAVLCHMDRTRYNPIPVGITQEGDWFLYTGDLDKIEADQWHTPQDCTPALLSPNRSVHELLVLEKDGVQRLPIDALFPILHGKNGEDGTVQGLAELTGIPLVGCGVLSSALCMDKDRAHRLVKAAGIAVPAAAVLDRGATAEEALECGAALGYPVFVKPVKAGSSYGITKVVKPEQLPAAVELAFQYDDQVIMEEAISGFEVGCAVLGNHELTAGVPDEIELSGGFFDFTEKYTLKTSSIHVPARVPAETLKAIQEAAKTIYRVLGCRGFARVDLFLDDSGRLVFNEVNTIPGFTSHSRYPSMMREAGLSFDQVITEAIELAFRWEEQQ